MTRFINRSSRLLLSTLCSISFFAVGCADLEDEESFENEEKVIGGILSRQTPAVVGLEYNGQIRCTGTLITKRSVLTSAQCVLAQREGQIVMNEPDFVVFSKGRRIKNKIAVVGSTIRGSFLRNGRNDLAILYLGARATANPIPVFDHRARELKDKNSIIVGYGLSEKGTSGIKREAKMRVVGHNNEFVFVHSRNGQHRTSCFGDTGGPVLVHKGGEAFIAGVLRGGSTSNCAEGQISFYTRVDDERAWINRSK